MFLFLTFLYFFSFLLWFFFLPLSHIPCLVFLYQFISLLIFPIIFLFISVLFNCTFIHFLYNCYFLFFYKVSKAELEKDDIVKQVSMATRGSTSRRQSLGPVRASRQSVGVGSGDVNKLRQTIDQIERDLNASRYSDGRRGFGGGEFERSNIGESLENLRDDMDRKDEQQERLIEQMKDLLEKYDQSENEKRQFAKELENVNNSFKVSSTELAKLNEELENKENLLKDSEKKRNELKAKALNSLKE